RPGAARQGPAGAVDQPAAGERRRRSRRRKRRGLSAAARDVRSMRTLSIGGVLAAALTLPVAARAQTKVTLVPSASVSVLSDDNVYLAATRSADQMTIITPGVQTMFENP